MVTALPRRAEAGKHFVRVAGDADMTIPISLSHFSQGKRRHQHASERKLRAEHRAGELLIERHAPRRRPSRAFPKFESHGMLETGRRPRMEGRPSDCAASWNRSSSISGATIPEPQTLESRGVIKKNGGRRRCHATSVRNAHDQRHR
jgi:hypothetical protein